MKKYQLIVDSCCDIPVEFYEKYDITVINYSISFNERTYQDRKEITADELVSMVEKSKIMPKTEPLSVSLLQQAFEKSLKDAEHLLFLTASSFISSTYDNALYAVKEAELSEKVSVIDSRSISSGIGLQAIGIAQDIEAKLSLEDILARAKERSERTRLFFSIQTMDFLQKSGKCFGLTYLLGNKFHIKPIVSIEDGKMQVSTLVKTKKSKKSAKHMAISFLKELKQENIDFNYPVFLPHVGAQKAVKKAIKKLDCNVGDNFVIPVTSSGVIAAHCGDDTIGVAYMAKTNR